MNIRGYQIEPCADLRRADLSYADLSYADLTRANLTGAILTCASLSRANLRCAILSKADLRGADLRCAILSKANLSNADLRGANLRGANLMGTDLRGAWLANTVLDPTSKPNGGSAVWEDAEILRGYRSRTKPFMGGPAYEIGKQYVAPYFSTCPRTACHPGLYVEPSRGASVKDCIVVEFRREDLHSAGGKHRVRKFTVIGESR